MDRAALLAAIAEASPGAVIDVLPGDYGDVRLSRVKGLTLRVQPGALLRSLELSQCEDIDIDDLAVAWAALDGAATKETVVRIAFSKRIALRRPKMRGQPVGSGVEGVRFATEDPPPRMNSLIAGLYAGRAVSVEFSDDVEISGGEISGFFSGVSIGNSSNVRILRNHIHDLRTTPIKGSGTGVVIEVNHLTHMTPYRYFDTALGKMMGDHLDFIHLFTGDGAPVEARIADNFLDAGEGFPAIGMLMEDRFGAGVTVDIEGNTLITAENQGIALSGNTRDARLVDNVLLGPPGAEKPPTFVIREGAVVREFRGNRAVDRSTKPKYAELYPDNTWLPRVAASAEDIEAARVAAVKRLGWTPAEPAEPEEPPIPPPAPDERDAKIAALKATLAEIRTIAIDSRTSRTVGPWDRVRGLAEKALA